MATVTPSPSPGYFLNGQTVSLAFDPSVVDVAYTLNGAPPSISKYIAYDTLTPPNPFIAVTQDGKGNVVYDGGFPKFYNSHAPVLGTTFASLNASFKYLYNALNFVSNKTKTSSGNKNVLVLGDSIVTETYSIKGTANNAFFTSLTNICTIAGYTATMKDRDDYVGGQLDARLSELENYCAVIIVSSIYSTGADYITPQCVNDIVTFRENGNGLIVITDHGPDLADIAEATTNLLGFFSTCNQILVKFGAYFTGNFDRTPVNVGFLRSTYGDHPLYANMLDSESINAGGSESKVVVTPNPLIPKANVGTVNVATNGLNSLQVLVTKTDGSIETFRWVYSIQGDEFVFNKSVNPGTGITESNVGKVYANVGGLFTMDVALDGTTLGTIWGEILNGNGKRIGEVYYDSTVGNKVYWYAGTVGVSPVNNGEVITTQIHIPFDYAKTATVQRKQPQVQNTVSLAVAVKELNSILGLNSALVNAFKKTYEQIDASLPAGLKGDKLNSAANIKCVRDFFGNRIQNGTLQGEIYDTAAGVTSRISALGTATPGRSFINAANGNVYAYKSGSYQVIAGLTAKDIFGAPRTVTNSLTTKSYKINTDGTIVLV